jgi:hypothetical protein
MTSGVSTPIPENGPVSSTRVSPQHPIALDELVDGEVGLHAGHVVERLDTVLGQRHHGLVGRVLGPWKQTTVARRPGTVPCSSNASSSALLGSRISIDANRQPARRPARGAESRRQC